MMETHDGIRFVRSGGIVYRVKKRPTYNKKQLKLVLKQFSHLEHFLGGQIS